MTSDDFYFCRFIKEELAYFTYEDFCQNRSIIRRFYNNMSQNEKLFYKWYVYANINMKPFLKDIIWDYLNGYDENGLILLKYYTKLKKR